MYIVKVRISIDNNFRYDDPEFPLEGDLGRTFYFERRKDAVSAILRSFYSVREHIQRSEDENMKVWFKFISNHIETICRKFPSFEIYKCFENKEIQYQLIYRNRIVFGHNRSCEYDFYYPTVTFRDFDEYSIPWNDFESLPDAD